jgi:hypothetical protein
MNKLDDKSPPLDMNQINFNKSSVSKATGYVLDGPVSIPVTARFFSPPQRPDRLWGLPSLLSNGYRGALSPEVKPQEREADHSPPSSAEVKNGGAIPPFLMSSWRGG